MAGSLLDEAMGEGVDKAAMAIPDTIQKTGEAIEKVKKDYQNFEEGLSPSDEPQRKPR